MSQAEIIKVLEKSRLPMSGREISQCLKQDYNKITKQLRKLLEYKEVKCIEINRHEALKHFGSKRKLRLYYLNQSDFIKAKDTLTYL